MNRLMFTFVASLMLTGCSSTAAPQPDATNQAPAPSMPMANPSADGGHDMIALALSAAPPDIAGHATVVDEHMKELRAGTNGWVCMAHPEVMCLDKQWQEWGDAWMNKRNPTITSVGFGYMLRGDQGASNTDPFATAPTPDNQWVISPPHIMVLTPDTRQLDTLPTDPHTGGPWVMWKGTPYAHVMVPTGAKPVEELTTSTH